MSMKKLLTKSLLVAICLLGGVNFVWGAPTSYLTTWTGLVGTDNTADLYYGTKKVRIAAGETYVFTIKNFNDGGADTWHNWVVEGNSGDKYFDCCANGDNWPFGEGAPTPSYTPVMATTDVADFMTKYNGATVTITISRNATGDQITVVHTSDVLGTTDGNTDKYYGGTYTIAVGAAEEWDVYLTQRYSHFVVTNVVYTESDGTTTHTYDGTAIESLPFYKTWTAESSIYPFDAGTIKTGNNVTALNINNTTGSAFFNILGNGSAYSLSTDEEVTVSLTAYHGWRGSGANQGIKWVNSQNNVIAEYVYNLNGCQITDVKIGGTTAQDFLTPFNCQSKKSDGGNANGFVGGSNNGNPYTTTDGYNPVITVNVRYDGFVTFNVALAQRGINNTYTGYLPVGWNVDLQKIQIYSNTNDPDRTLAINNLSITSAFAERANYTVKYVDEDSQDIADEVIYSGVIGSKPVLLSGDKATRYNALNTKKYTYVSDDSSDKTIANDGSTIITVVFSTHDIFSYSVTNSLGETIENGSLFDDESKAVSWAKYILHDGKYYETSAPYQFTVNSTNKTKEVSYTPSPITQYVEATSSNWASTSDETGNYSGGIAYRGATVAKTLMTVAEDGIYTLSFTVCSSNVGTGKEITLSVYKNAEAEANKLHSDYTINHSYSYITSTGTIIIEDLDLLAGETILLKSNKTTCILDYVTLTKTATPATIGANGYTTFASPYCLDLANLPEGLKAYTATLDGKALSFAECTQAVPVGTGLLLAGTGGETYNIPVTTTGTAVSGNALTGVTATTDLKSDETNYIFAMKKASQATDPLTFAPLASTNVSFPAGKAYITVPVSAFSNNPGARALTISFEEATGITSMPDAQCTMHNDVYNLQGQRISSPKKGLYIVNGAKVVIK